MSDREFNFNFTAETSELTIRMGEAPKIHDPKVYNETGTIEAPGNYLKVIGCDNKKASVVYSKTSGNKFITLLTDPNSVFGNEISGEIKDNPDLSNFSINGNKVYDLKSIKDFLRRNRLYFDSAQEYTSVITSLNDFRFSQKTDGKIQDDRRSNTSVQIQKTTNVEDMKFEFKLNIPVYKGFPNSTFRVEIYMDLSDAAVKFWFESIELIELQKILADKAIEEQLKLFEGYLLIEK